MVIAALSQVLIRVVLFLAPPGPAHLLTSAQCWPFWCEGVVLMLWGLACFCFVCSRFPWFSRKLHYGGGVCACACARVCACAHACTVLATAEEGALQSLGGSRHLLFTVLVVPSTSAVVTGTSYLVHEDLSHLFHWQVSSFVRPPDLAQ